jgi:SAM domain (Sterile alpha motif)
MSRQVVYRAQDYPAKADGPQETASPGQECWPAVRVKPEAGATLDVGDWLRSLGLEQYEAAFRDNEIDAAVLPKLMFDDLKDLGVAAVGQSRCAMSGFGTGRLMHAAARARRFPFLPSFSGEEFLWRALFLAFFLGGQFLRGSAKVTLGHVDYLASLFCRGGGHMPRLFRTEPLPATTAKDARSTRSEIGLEGRPRRLRSPKLTTLRRTPKACSAFSL